MADEAHSRRVALGNEILAAFEDRGWQWTEEEVVRGIKGVLDTEPAARSGCFESNVLRLHIGRLFGESQVVLRLQDLGGLVKKFRDHLVQAMKGTSQADHATILPLLQSRDMERELNALAASSQDILPAACIRFDQGRLRTVIALARTLRVVDKGALESIPFQRVAWVVAEAVKNAESLQATDKSLLRYRLRWGEEEGKKHRIEAYTREEHQTRSTRQELVRHVLPTLVNFEEHTLAWYVVKVLEHLANIEFEPRYTNVFPHRPYRSDWHLSGVEQLVQMYGAEVEEAILQSFIVQQTAEFAEPRHPFRNSQPPIPTNQVHLIQHLDLQVDIKCFGRLYVPSRLFNTQVNLPKLKDWFPALKWLRVDVAFSDHWGWAPPSILLRGEDEVPTTFETEMMRLVHVMRDLTIRNTWIRCSRHPDYPRRASREPVYIAADSDEMISVSSFVGELLFHPSVSFEVKKVSVGMADVSQSLAQEFGSAW